MKTDSEWKNKIQDLLDKEIVDYELPAGSLNLMTNTGRDNETTTSYTICIYEPEFPFTKSPESDPSRNQTVINIKDGKQLELLVRNSQYDAIELPKEAIVKELKSDHTFHHVIIDHDSRFLIDYIKRNVEYCLKHYVSKASYFGCCNRFIECSDAKKCVHENKLYSKACYYRKNLDAGNIFYGKNKNV